MRNVPRRGFLLGGATALLAAACRSTSDSSDAGAAAEIGPLVAPAALAGRLDDVKSGKIAVLYVGPDTLFGRGHVPGARNVGEAGSSEGRRALSSALALVPKEAEIVLYCGCCPYRNCPNVRPASAALKELGRPNARVLDLPTRFATDWADKGYPVERS
jgi:thiosulfate/3-mercaptopyruvate sulfurtransferase